MQAKQTTFVHPESPADIERWAKKWRVSREAVYDAILHTGSLAPESLKRYVHRDRWIYHPISSASNILKAGINLIF